MSDAIRSIPLEWFLLLIAGAIVCAVTVAEVFHRAAAHRHWLRKRRRRK